MTLPRETTPKELSPKVLEFCQGITVGEPPVFVHVQPFDGAEWGRCLENVARYAAQFGGSTLLGWRIWERPKVNLRAEFYAVWKAPNGEVVDVSPKSDGENRILFLPDPKLVWQGRPIPSRVLPLLHWREIQEYLTADAKLRNMPQPDISTTDMTEYVRTQAELKRAIQALEKRLARS